MSTTLSDSGLLLASGNIIDLKAAMPTTGTYTAGDIVLESTTGTRVSGWKRQTAGSGNVLGTDWVYFSDGSVLMTAQNTTSGTSIDFTGIPSWVKRVTVMLNGVSGNGTSVFQIQVGSGSISTAGYASQAWGATGSGVVTTGIILSTTNTAANTWTGHVVLTLIGANQWITSGVLNVDNATSSGVQIIGKTPSLAGALDRLRFTTVNGTDTFDAGSVNILYE